MNINNLSSELKFANRIGQTLSIQQRDCLQTNVIKLSHQYQCQKFNFWGRIQGIAKNYFIVEGVNFKGCTNFPEKKFFWSNDDFRFAQLPAPRFEYWGLIKNSNQLFTGQHEKILLKAALANGKILNVRGQQLLIKPKNFTELDRLSLVVREIERQCQIVPLGAYKMIPTHQLIPNPDFRGLKMEPAKSLDNYLHLRQPVLGQKKILIQCDKALERLDFMDPISQDQIKKSWSLQTDQSGTEITVRSLLWPGYVGYHRTNSSIFGGVYLGTGIKSQDLQFIL